MNMECKCDLTKVKQHWDCSLAEPRPETKEDNLEKAARLLRELTKECVMCGRADSHSHEGKTGTIHYEKPETKKCVCLDIRVPHPECPVHKPETNGSEWECRQCGKPRDKHHKKYCSQECYWKSMEGVKNEKAPNWKGENTGKDNIHTWLEVNYGKPTICENPSCMGKSKTYDWAKKTEAEYVKDRNAFYRLCRSCHRTYDLTPEKREQALKNLWWSKDSKSESHAKPILQYSKDGVFIKEYPSITEAALAIGKSQVQVSYAASGVRKSAGGYIWKIK